MGTRQQNIAVAGKFAQQIRGNHPGKFGGLLEFLDPRSIKHSKTDSNRFNGSYLRIIEVDSNCIASTEEFDVRVGIKRAEDFNPKLTEALLKNLNPGVEPALRIVIWRAHHRDVMNNTLLDFLASLWELDPEFCAANMYACSRAAEPDHYEKEQVTVSLASERSYFQLILDRDTFLTAIMFEGKGAKQNLVIFGLESREPEGLKALPNSIKAWSPQLLEHPLHVLIPYIHGHLTSVENWYFKNMKINAGPDHKRPNMKSSERLDAVFSLRFGLRTSSENLRLFQRYNKDANNPKKAFGKRQFNDVIMQYDNLIKRLSWMATVIPVRIQQEQFDETIKLATYAHRYGYRAPALGKIVKQTRFAIVASVYLPWSLASSIFGMNVKPFNEQLSYIWPIVCAVGLISVSVMIFWLGSLRRGLIPLGKWNASSFRT